MSSLARAFTIARPTPILSSSVAFASGAILPAAALFYIVAYIYIALSRMSYPFDLEWMEGGSLVQVKRVLSGVPLYVRPSLDYVASIYPPLYCHVSALVSQLVGPGFLALRLVSFASSLGCFVLIFLLVKRQTDSTLSGWLAAGLFAATFQVCGDWFDLARVDSLFLVLLLLGLFLIKLDTRLSHCLAGFAFSVGFLTKQTACIALLPMAAYAVLASRRNVPYLLATFIVVMGASNAYLNSTSGGWYTYYALHLPSKHHIVLSVNGAVSFWTVLAPLFIALLVGLSSFVLPRVSPLTGKDWLFHLMMAAGLLGTSFLGWLNPGGFRNVLMPGCAAIAILFGIGFSTLSALVASRPTQQRLLARLLVCAACVLQFAALAYPISAQIPTADDLKVGGELVERIRGLEGDVYMPWHNYLPLLAGKPGFLHQVALIEIRGRFGGGDKEMWTKVHDELRTAMQEGRFAAVILDDDYYRDELSAHYVRHTPVFSSKAVFWPVTGQRTRPEIMYVLKNGEPRREPEDWGLLR